MTGERLSAYCFSGGGEHPPAVLAARDFSWLKRSELRFLSFYHFFDVDCNQCKQLSEPHASTICHKERFIHIVYIIILMLFFYN